MRRWTLLNKTCHQSKSQEFKHKIFHSFSNPIRLRRHSITILTMYKCYLQEGTLHQLNAMTRFDCRSGHREHHITSFHVTHHCQLIDYWEAIPTWLKGRVTWFQLFTRRWMDGGASTGKEGWTPTWIIEKLWLRIDRTQSMCRCRIERSGWALDFDIQKSLSKKQGLL